MKHVAAAFLSIVLILFAGILVWSNRLAPSTPILGFSGFCIGSAILIALGTDGKEVLTTLAGFIPMLRGKGVP